MRRQLPILVAATLAACSSNDPDAGKKGPVDTGTQPICAIDLAPFRTGGAGAASARRIAGEADLVGGEAAQGVVGDFLLENDRLRAVVQGSDRTIGVNPYGGNLIDIDVVRDGEPGRDVLGEIAPFYNLGRTTDPEAEADVFVLHDGSDGRAAVVAVNGRDTVNDYVAVGSLLRNALGGSDLAIDGEKPVPAAITSYFVLAPGSGHLVQITAFCNTSGETLVLGVGDLVDSGGNVEAFNPHLGDGWGSSSTPKDAPFLAWVGATGGYALVPGDGNQKNQVLSTSGVTGTLQGSSSLFEYTGKLDLQAPPSGALIVPAGGRASYERRIVPGASLAAITAEIAALRGDETGTVRGTVLAGDRPAAGARVAAVRTSGGREITETVFVADEAGAFEGSLPAGDYRLLASLPGQLSGEQPIRVTSGGAAAATLELGATGTLTVQVRDANGDLPTAGRVHVLCAGPCATPRDAETRFRDVGADPLPEGVFAIGHADLSGTIRFELPAGPWEVLVSRGAEYDTFPADFPDTGHGHAVAVGAGETAEVVAPVARVIDTTGWISADFHVHAINSPDSPVPNRDRVVSFLAEQVEVLVQTDHEYVTDLGPEVEALDATSQIRTIVGTEVTTFDYGHVNAFPLTVDPGQRNGGAIDWAGGRGPTLTPAGIFAAARERGAEVVQLNHARSEGNSMGHLDALRVDTATLATHADPVSFRMEPNGEDPAVDSKLFSKDFTAIEILNGFSEGNFRALLNDWTTFLGQGFVVTGTAVSDTHKLASSGPGSPRSWVFLGDDDPATVDVAALAAAVNAGRVVGGSAPFVTVEAASGGATAGVGETLATGGGELELRVVVQSPRWAKFNRIEVFSWRPEAAAVNGIWNPLLPPDAVAVQADGAAASARIDLADPAFTVDGFEGGGDHPAYRVERTFRFAPAADTFYIVLVRTVTKAADGLEEGEVVPPTLSPIAYDTGGRAARAAAFTNPIFVDVDGGGYDRFPLLQAMEQGLVRTGAPGRAAAPPPADEAAFHERLEHLNHRH